MQIDNINIYNLEQAIVASGLPMLPEHNAKEFHDNADIVSLLEMDNPHIKRARRLADNPAGSGHNNFLSGILVSMNVTATNVWWMQLERYHFVQIVSSQSKMHRLKEMLKSENVTSHFNEKTSMYVAGDYIVNAQKEDIAEEELVYSCPMGLELTAHITTNYLQLKTIYNQRKNHKLEEWRSFCRTIETLPMAKEFITK